MPHLIRCSLVLIVAASFCLAASPAPRYSPGTALGKSSHLGRISCMTLGKDDSILAATGGKVLSFVAGSEAPQASFDTGLKSIDAITCSQDAIYVFSNQSSLKTVEVNNRKVQQPVPTGVTCRRLSLDGKQLEDLNLPSLKRATSAAVFEGNLYVADLNNRTIHVFDATTGAPVGKIGKNMRLCCGIFSFSVDAPSKQLLISNLGAYKVQRYDLSGAFLSEFGSKGESDKGFQGCCNPVSTVVLPGGGLVTVEKEPSRVKVYTPKGELLQVFPNLEELVQGCQKVSVVADSKGRVYLGVNAKQNFILQYVPASL